MTRISEAHVARLGYTGRVVVRHASSSEIRAGLKKLLTRKVRRCAECDFYPADPPSRFCPGCEAYREHQA